MKFFAATQKFQRVQSRLALLLALVLLTHSLDVCAAHTGIPNLPAAPVFQVTHGAAICSAPPGVACLCAECACVPVPIQEHHDDCAASSELATRAQSSNHHFEAPLTTFSYLATVPDEAIQPAPLAAFLGGNGPPLARLRSQFFLSSLPGRAPPVTL